MTDTELLDDIKGFNKKYGKLHSVYKILP